MNNRFVDFGLSNDAKNFLADMEMCVVQSSGYLQHPWLSGLAQRQLSTYIDWGKDNEPRYKEVSQKLIQLHDGRVVNFMCLEDQQGQRVHEWSEGVISYNVKGVIEGWLGIVSYTIEVPQRDVTTVSFTITKETTSCT